MFRSCVKAFDSGFMPAVSYSVIGGKDAETKQTT
jgi:hypothetical protein